MKFLKLFAVTFLSVTLVMSAAGCSSISGIMNDIKNGKMLKTGDDYIEYTNSKREKVVEPYIGDKLDTDTAKPLLENIELSYDEVEGKDNTYTVYIDNTNGEYFFDGVFTLESDEETFRINVDMLAPESYDYFDLEIKGNPDDYQYYAQGNLYDWSKESLEADSKNDQYILNDEGTEVLVVVDEDEITEDILKNFGEVFYKYDTVYNLNEPTTYYFVTSKEYNGTDYSNYEYEMVVDTAARSADVKDANGDSVFTETY